MTLPLEGCRLLAAEGDLPQLLVSQYLDGSEQAVILTQGGKLLRWGESFFVQR